MLGAKAYFNFMAPFYGWVSTSSRLQSHYEEVVYFFLKALKKSCFYFVEKSYQSHVQQYDDMNGSAFVWGLVWELVNPKLTPKKERGDSNR